MARRLATGKSSSPSCTRIGNKSALAYGGAATWRRRYPNRIIIEGAVIMAAEESRTEKTRSVVLKYFSDLERGDLESALSRLAPDVDFQLPVDQWNDVIP